MQPDAPEYKTVFQALRQAHRLDEKRDQLNQSVARVTDWTNRVPASLRDGLLALIADVNGAWRNDVCNALSDTFFAQLAPLADASDHYTEAQLHDALSQPTTLVATLQAVSRALAVPVGEWLTDEYAAPLTRAAGMGAG